jgi:hypothetical protein
MGNNSSLPYPSDRWKRHEDAPIRRAHIITSDSDICMHPGLTANEDCEYYVCSQQQIDSAVCFSQVVSVKPYATVNVAS